MMLRHQKVDLPLKIAVVAALAIGFSGLPASAQEPPTPQAWSAAPSPDSVPVLAQKRPGFDAKLLAPVAGVDYRTYGHATYALFRDPKGDQASILKRFGLSKANYDEANTVFGERMKNDQSFAMVEMFGAYFNETADGAYAAYARDAARSVLEQVPLQEKEPMPEERFREIQSFYGRKAIVAGTDLVQQDEVLKPYRLTFNDFNILGAWFSRRLMLQSSAAFPTPDADDEARAQAPAAVEHPEWGGDWRFSWKILKRTDAKMEVKEESRNICLRADMTAQTLPLMPKPEGGQCVLVSLKFYETGIQISAQCDYGKYGTSWGVYLQPQKDKRFIGDISYNEMNEDDDDLPQPSTSVEADRIGDCP